MPDRQRNRRFCFDRLPMVAVPPLKKAIAQAMTRITTVRMAVARSVSTPLMPTLAKMAVSAAKNAESKAYIHHIRYGFEVDGMKFRYNSGSNWKLRETAS